MKFNLNKCTPAHVLVAAVLVYAAFYAVAFVRIYGEKHPYFTASEWIYENVPPGSRLYGPHWDDRLPLSIDGHNAPQTYEMEGASTDLDVYERDTPDKLNALLTKVARADYLVFPTPRVQGSIPRVPEEYISTTPFFQLLWAEKLGYKLAATFKNRPNFLGVTFNDDLADESFSVYDHPKVTIFRNVDHLPMAELRRRILNKDQYEPLPTMNQILLADVGGVAPKDERRGWLDAAFAILVVEILGISAWVFVGTLVTGVGDAGLGVSKALGVLVCAMVCRLVAPLAGGTMTRSACALVVGLAACAAIGGATIRKQWRSRMRDVLREHWSGVEVAFLVTTIVFLAVRACAPEVGGGERAIFSSLLGFFARNDHFPAQDPWSAGLPLLFPGGAPYLFGWLFKITGAPVTTAYNISLALCGGLAAAALYSLFTSWGIRSWIAVYGACGVALLASPFFAILSATGDEGWLSRMALEGVSALSFFTALASGTSIDILVGTVLGLVFLFLLLEAIELVNQGATSRSVAVGAFSGAIASGIVTVSLPCALLFGATAILVVTLYVGGMYSGSSVRASLAAWRLVPALTTILCTGLILLAVLFSGDLRWQRLAPWASPDSEPVIALGVLGDILAAWPLWVVLALTGWGLHLFMSRSESNSPRAFSFAPVAIPVAVVIFRGVGGWSEPPLVLICFSTVLIFLVGFLSFPRREWRMESFMRAAVVAAALSLLVGDLAASASPLAIPQLFVASTVLVALVGSACAARAFSNSDVSIPRGALAVVGGVVLIGAASSTFFAFAATNARGALADGLTLNSAARIGETNPSDFALIGYINRSLHGAPVLIEAGGRPYERTARISVHTGLPSVLGWDEVGRLRSLSEDSLRARRAAVDEIYSDEDARKAYESCMGYGVDLIVVSTLERQRYDPAGLAKFDLHPEFFAKLFDVDGGALYATAFSQWYPKATAQ